MIISVYRFTIISGLLEWHGNLTHPYPIRYVYTAEELDSDLQD